MPSKIYIGNDIVYLPRFSKSLEKDAFVQKVFHQNEQKICSQKPDPLSSFAARFAAKEAFAKALGTGLYSEGVTPTDIWIESHANGKPYLCFSDKLIQMLKEKEIHHWDVSLSHHGDYAIAHVILN